MTQQRVLGLLFGQPDRSFFASEIIALAGAGSGAVQRELGKLETSGLVTISRIGTQKHFQANPGAPIFEELVGIVTKTVGLADPLRVALKKHAGRIQVAFVFGSVAKANDRAASDIDLMVIGDGIDYVDVYASLHATEARFGRQINPTLLTKAALARKRREDGFVSRVLEQPKIFIIGSAADLDA